MRRRHDHRSGHDAAAEVVRSQEELRGGTGTVDAVRARIRRSVDEDRVRQLVPRSTEHADVEREPVADADSGEIETLADGSVSIPLFEEGSRS